MLWLHFVYCLLFNLCTLNAYSHSLHFFFKETTLLSTPRTPREQLDMQFPGVWDFRVVKGGTHVLNQTVV